LNNNIGTPSDYIQKSKDYLNYVSVKNRLFQKAADIPGFEKQAALVGGKNTQGANEMNVDRIKMFDNLVNESVDAIKKRSLHNRQNSDINSYNSYSR